MRPTLAPCTIENNCQGSVLIVASLLGAFLSFALYKSNQKKTEKIFNLSQERRLVLGALCWIGLLIIVAIEMLIRNYF